jgi:hypothetical protein
LIEKTKNAAPSRQGHLWSAIFVFSRCKKLPEGRFYYFSRQVVNGLSG